MSHYVVEWAPRFKRDYKRAIKRGLDIERLQAAIGCLAIGDKLPAFYKDHPLKGNHAGERECHIGPDWLLVYVRDDEILRILLLRTGTHRELGLGG